MIVLDRLSGGYDDDGRPGDDGVVVYVRPVDKVGDALKTAGAIRVQVFDLAEGEGHLVGDCFVPAEKAGEIWYGKLLTYHFTKLREAGVTRARVEGTSRLISLRREEFDRRFPGLLDSVIEAARRDPNLPRIPDGQLCRA